MLTFQKKYFFITVFLFIVEVLIAIYVHDDFIRPYGGDFLVVILIYTFVKAFLNISVLSACIGVLLFSYLTETLQYFKIVELLGLSHSNLAKIIIGTSFAWEDMIAYTLGILMVYFIEKKNNNIGNGV